MSRRCEACDEPVEDPFNDFCNRSFCTSRRYQQLQQGLFERPVDSSNCSNTPEAYCSLHEEKFRLFCLDHKQLACLVCRDSEKHVNHSFSPLDEAAQDLRAELRMALWPAQNQLKELSQVKEQWELTGRHITAQAGSTEKQIRERFAELRRFLSEEEEARISALREEEELKSRFVKEKTDVLRGETAALTESITAVEEILQSSDISFLLRYKAAADGVQQRPPLDKPKLPQGALLDQAKHLGNLTFNVWNKMKDTVRYTPLVLDPNTADQSLVLSDDLTSLSMDPDQNPEPPQNPERLRMWSALASRSFDSGNHSWDVDVADNMRWELGLVEDSEPQPTSPESGLWALSFEENQLTATSPAGGTVPLSVSGRQERIRVCLDWDGRTLSFTDPHSNTEIHTFTHTFTQRMIPYFYNCRKKSLQILPARITVAVEQ